MDAVLVANVAKTIKEMRKDGTVGCSVANLKQMTPTLGLTLAVGEYHAQFPIVAKAVAKRLKFDLYE